MAIFALICTVCDSLSPFEPAGRRFNSCRAHHFSKRSLSARALLSYGDAVSAPYLVIVLGLLLFIAGLGIDLTQHGIDFVINEFRQAPVAHGLPLIGIVLVIIGTGLAWRQTKRMDRG